MRAQSIAMVLLVLFAGRGAAQDAIPAEVLTAIKSATVFVKIKADFSYGSGSGFFMHVDKEFGYIVTNRHVVEDNPFDLQKRQLQVVFHAGTPDEMVLNADVLGSMKTEDLAIVRVKASKGLPKPLQLETKQIPTETTTVYSFGFPFGKLLASSKRSPEITIGRATVSSLRRNDRRELKSIQLDGSLNPGNSGGPVTDAKGRVVGVVVAGVRGSNIGFAIPAAMVGRLLDGTAGGARVESKKADDKSTAIEITAPLLDPKVQLKSIAFRYVREDSLAIEPDREDTEPLEKTKSLDLTRENAIAKGNLISTAADRGKTFWFQVAYVGADGVTRYTAPENFRLSAAGKISSFNANLDRYKGDSITVVYELKDPRARAEVDAKMRTLVGNKSFGRATNFAGKQRLDFYPVNDPNGFVERLEQSIGRIVRIDANVITLEVELPPEIARSVELLAKFEKLTVKGKINEPTVLHKSDVLDADAWKRLAAAAGKKDLRKSGAPGGGKGEEGADEVLEEGAILIGMQIARGNFITAVAPIYLTAKGEKMGTRIGGVSKKLSTLKAEPGYAVGAIILSNGDLLDSITLVFMKMKADGLDVSDAYRSPRVGTDGGHPATVGGDGAFLVGVQHKALTAAYILPVGAPTSVGVMSLKK